MQYAVLGFTLLQLAQADLPVHCLLQDVAGEWEFHVGPPQAPAFADMVGGIPQCGHHIPNQVVSMLTADPDKEVPSKTMEKFRITLTEDIQMDPIRHLHVKGGDKADSKAAGNLAAGGYWTMVFDEGFEVRSQEGRSFFAHFDFEVLPNASKEPSHGDRWDDIAKYYGRIPQVPGTIDGQQLMKTKGELYSCHCDRLSVGWWHQHNKEGKLESGCFWAQKVKKEEKSEATSFIRWSKKDGKKSEEALSPNKLRGASKSAVVSLHNLEGMSDADDLGRILDISEIPSNMDRRASSNKEVLLPASRELKDDLNRAAAKSFVEIADPAQKIAKVAQNVSDLMRSMPKAWDWRHVVQDMSGPGIDDLSEQFSQGNCGSCYAFSGSQVLAMRYRIRLFQKHKILYPLELSWRSATQCSPYTEGCEGGFAYLTFKYAAEMGLPLASCDKHKAPDTLDNTCDWSCYRNNKMIFYAKDYGQTGGFAHGSNEESIMNEIHKNGPVIVSFATSAVPEFIYNNGQSMRDETEVLTVIRNDKVPRETSSKNSKILPWSYTTHSILAVGWGEEVDAKGAVQKYWIVRNSWGKDWGVQGYAKIRRGNNDAAIETSAPWVEPDMDRLPEGFLEMAQKYHDEQAATRAKTAAAAGASDSEAKAAKAKGGKPAYCKLRPDSPDCK